jgi:hypothetical protein
MLHAIVSHSSGSSCQRIATPAVESSYPARGEPDAAPEPDARPARSQGRFPVVVLLPGASTTADDFLTLLRHWAAAGYVVLAPGLPLTGAGAAGARAVIADSVNHPDDVRFLIGQLKRKGRSRPRSRSGRHHEAHRARGELARVEDDVDHGVRPVLSGASRTRRHRDLRGPDRLLGGRPRACAVSPTATPTPLRRTGRVRRTSPRHRHRSISSPSWGAATGSPPTVSPHPLGSMCWQ